MARSGRDRGTLRGRAHCNPSCAEVQTVPGTYDVSGDKFLLHSTQLFYVPALETILYIPFLRSTFERRVDWFPWTLPTRLSR